VSDKQAVLQEAADAYAELRQSISDLDAGRAGHAWLGTWGVREILAHTSGWIREMRPALERIRRGEPPFPEGVSYDDADAWNARFVESRRGVGLADVLAELETVHREFLAAASAISGEHFAPGAATLELFLGSSSQHYREHADQIRGWRKEIGPAMMNCARTREHRYALFDTTLGGCGIAWSERGIVRIQLPEADQARTARRLADGGAVAEARPPSWVAHTIRGLVLHLQGALQDFSGVPLDMSRIAPFPGRVYAAARAIDAGRTTTYGTLATLVGAPGDARAVGRALGANPFGLVVPCHRVVAAGGRIGGFSAHGGATTKARLLAIEGLTTPASQLSLGLTRTGGPGD